MSERTSARLCVAFIVAYFAVLLSQVGHGVATLDAHGIMAAARSWALHHVVPVSRPPGHPTTEIYLFGSFAQVLQAFGYQFSNRAYLLAQACGAVATLFVFSNLLRSLKVGGWSRLLAVMAMALSAQFFANAVDGEEFVFALLFLLVAVRLLIAPHPLSLVRLALSIFAFALATGCRPEIVFAGIIYPVYLLTTRADWRRIVFVVAALPVIGLIVWLPLILHGLQAPWGAGTTFREAILAGGYKLPFQCFGVIVFALLLVALGRACRRALQLRNHAFPHNFSAAFSCALSLLYLALFFAYPAKAAYALPALPFLLIAAADYPGLLIAITVFTLIDDFVRIDIFRERRLVAPYFTRGSAVATVKQKPFYRLPYLRALPAQCGDNPTTVVAEAWPWDFEYHIARGSFQAQEKDETGEFPQFIPERAGVCVLLPREAAFSPALLQQWRERGYEIKMDTALYRTAFGRYDVSSSQRPTDVKLFSIRP